MTQVDQQIYALLQEIRRHAEPPSTAARQKALNRLLILMQYQPGLLRSSHQDYPQALNRTWEWFSQNIHKFDPDLVPVEGVGRKLVIWINGYLKWRITDLYANDAHSPISLDRPITNDEGEAITLKDKLPDPAFTPLSLDLLDQKIEKLQQKQNERLGQQIKQSIETDDQQQLCRCYPRNRPDCNCHELALRLLMQQPPQRLSEIARELDINNQTLYSHWNQKCLPLLQAIARRFGYPS